MSRETDRPHRALEAESVEAEIWKMLKACGGNAHPEAVAECAHHIAVLAPEQRGDAEPEAWLIERQKDGEWRRSGVADYEGEAAHFAQDERRAGYPTRVVPLYRALAAPPQEGERQPCACDADGPCLYHGELAPAPTPDREALHKKLYSALIAYAENRLTLGEAADRILATLAALPSGREREEEIRASVYEDAALIAEECATGKRAAKELRTAAEGARALAAAPQASTDTGER
jgi:hypothetical protein